MITRPSTLRWWLALGVVIVGFATVAIFMVPGDLREPELPPELADEPDAYLEGGVITQYRADGTLNYRLRTSRIAHFERDGVTRLSVPEFELHSPQAPPWHISSESGETVRVLDSSSGQEEQVRLHGDVRLIQNGGSAGFTEVRTESLLLYPKRQFARAAEPVIITTGAGSGSAAGIEADLSSGRMRLFSSNSQRVRIVVQPDQLEK